MQKSKKNEFQKVVDHFGGVDSLAKALGITRQAIYMWAGTVPEGRAYQIETITNRKFTAVKLISAEPNEVRA